MRREPTEQGGTALERPGPTPPTITVEAPAPGLEVAQPARGFRYGSEAFWLAGFALEGGRPASAVDLGTGSGIVAMLLAGAGVASVGLDVRPEWSACWTETLARSTPAASCALRLHDVADPLPLRAELVVTNPPFYPSASGPVAADPWKRAARTESSATLARFVAAGLDALEAGGRLCAVIPVERSGEVERAGLAAGAAVRRVVQVGRRRTLVELGDPVAQVERSVVGEHAPRVRAWYAAVAGRGVAS